MPYRNPAFEPSSPPLPLAPRYRPRGRRATMARSLMPVLPLIATGIWAALAGPMAPDRSAFEWPALWFGLTLLVDIVWIGRVQRRRRRALAQLNESAALARSGSYAGNRDVCERILDTFPEQGNVTSVALNNLSLTAYAEGDLARALALIDAVEGSGWARRGTALYPLVCQNHGLYLALRGDVEEAKCKLHEARSAMTTAQAEVSLFAPEVVLSARTGKLAEVVSRTGTPAAAPRLQNRLVRLLRAYALAQTAGDSADEEMRILVDGAKPVVPGELAYLHNHWPELTTFLRARGLGPALARA